MIITIIIFIVLLSATNGKLYREKQKYLNEIDRLETVNTELNAINAEYNSDISEYIETIHKLKMENKKYKIIYDLKECPVCGDKDISIYSTDKTTTVSCNHCYTKVDFNEPIESISENRIKQVWDNLHIKLLQ